MDFDRLNLFKTQRKEFWKVQFGEKTQEKWWIWEKDKNSVAGLREREREREQNEMKEKKMNCSLNAR